MLSGTTTPLCHLGGPVAVKMIQIAYDAMEAVRWRWFTVVRRGRIETREGNFEMRWEDWGASGEGGLRSLQQWRAGGVEIANGPCEWQKITSIAAVRLEWNQNTGFLVVAQAPSRREMGCLVVRTDLTI